MIFVEADPDMEDDIVAFDEAMVPGWICDVSAVKAGYGRVRRAAIREFMSREQSTVVVAIDDGEVVGYVVVDKLAGDGCRGRWVGAYPQEGVDVAEVLKGLLDAVCDRYGWVTGRLTNPLINDTLTGFGCVPAADDPTVLTYRRS